MSLKTRSKSIAEFRQNAGHRRQRSITFSQIEDFKTSENFNSKITKTKRKHSFANLFTKGILVNSKNENLDSNDNKTEERIEIYEVPENQTFCILENTSMHYNFFSFFYDSLRFKNCNQVWTPCMFPNH